jgi:hypothetical protein
MVTRDNQVFIVLQDGVERVPDLAISADYVMKLISTSN